MPRNTERPDDLPDLGITEPECTDIWCPSEELQAEAEAEQRESK